MDGEIKAILVNMIEKKQRALTGGDVDLLGLLLESGMSTEDIIEECKLFFIAGQETSANLLTWTIIVLSLHPTWQEKAREEVLRLCGKNTPTFDALNRLKIVSSIIIKFY